MDREKAKEIAKNKMHFDSDGFGTVDIDDVIDVMLECSLLVNLCTCTEDETTGTTQVKCCNICGKPTEKFWKGK